MYTFTSILEIKIYKEIQTRKVTHEHDLKFNSKFESGNLSAVTKINKKEYWLFMREDTNTHGLRQWFYF